MRLDKVLPSVSAKKAKHAQRGFLDQQRRSIHSGARLYHSFSKVRNKSFIKLFLRFPEPERLID